jgi:hypothetical protein
MVVLFLGAAHWVYMTYLKYRERSAHPTKGLSDEDAISRLDAIIADPITSSETREKAKAARKRLKEDAESHET